MEIIYHITHKSTWNTALAAGSYAADSLATEGYIHCSTAQQVLATANRLFRNRRDLVLLCIDSARIDAEVRYENLEGGTELYPHVYGALELVSVVATHDFPAGVDGCFEMPPPLSPA